MKEQFKTDKTDKHSSFGTVAIQDSNKAAGHCAMQADPNAAWNC